jgi:comEA protein
MNNKEKAVLYFLIASLLIGSSISLYKKHKIQKNIVAIETETTLISDSLTKATSKPARSKSTKAEFNSQIDINQATPDELEALPGIGPVLAQRIIAERNRVGKFSSLEGLLKVKGIGEKKLAKIKGQIIIKP